MCKPQDAHKEKSSLPKVTSCCPWADSLTGQINKLSRDLMALRDQLHELVTHRKSAWEEKVRFQVVFVIINEFSDPVFYQLSCCSPSQGSLPVAALCQPCCRSTVSCLFMPTACQVLFQTQSRHPSQRGSVLKQSKCSCIWKGWHQRTEVTEDTGRREEEEIVAAPGGDRGRS